MVFIYILKLESNKYYIGKTTNPNFRLNQHFNSNGCAWTKKYQPIKIIEIIPDCDNFDEDKYTKKYMLKYGINNVRGGTFCQIKLNTDNISTIQKELDGATDKCYNCGENGHFANECQNNDNDELQKMYEKLYQELKKQDRCFRCHRIGHYAENCYAKTFDNGEEICDDDNEELIYTTIWCCEYCGKEFDTEKGAQFHENIYCKKKQIPKKKSYKDDNNYSKKNNCYRCGRIGHFSDNCYASKHIKGYYLS